MPGTHISGKDGTIKISTVVVAGITKWDMDKKAETDSKATNESGGFKAACAGPKSITGTVEGLLDRAAASTILEGTAATLLLYINATIFYTVPAIMSNFRPSVNIDSGAFISFTASFVSNGAYTEPTWA